MAFRLLSNVRRSYVQLNLGVACETSTAVATIGPWLSSLYARTAPSNHGCPWGCFHASRSPRELTTNSDFEVSLVAIGTRYVALRFGERNRRPCRRYLRSVVHSLCRCLGPRLDRKFLHLHRHHRLIPRNVITIVL